MIAFLLTLAAPGAGLAALGGALAAAAVVILRRPGVPVGTYLFSGLGLLMLWLAAGGLTWDRPAEREVAVMVDLSPSTRTASYRDRAALDRRIHTLLGKTPYRLWFFASGANTQDASGSSLADIPAEQTVFNPVPESAVVLFSDARFEIPIVLPPTFVVVDPALDAPADAAVSSLELRGNEAAIRLSNSGPPRKVVVQGLAGNTPTTAPSGSIVLTSSVDPKAAEISVELSAGDAWPENDVLSARPAPPTEAERWWVGNSDPGPGWRHFEPATLPPDPAAYLAPAVIVLENLAATNLADRQQQRLTQYVRDLGGGLIILGGDHAFAAGQYPGTPLEILSPLASTPPQPAMHWMLLADSSGSMATSAAGSTRWKFATDALVRLIPHLPPQDPVSVGSFAERLSWWSAGKSAKETALPLPPQDVYPHGPTNLQPALEAIARSADDTMPKQLLLLTDADAQIENPAALTALLQSKQIRLHLLAIGEGSGLPALRQIIAGTGGSLVTQLDPAQWIAAVQELLRSASPDLLGRDPVTVRFQGDLREMSPVTVAPWNRTWLKEGAAALAEAQHGSESLVMAGRWNVGGGQVLSTAFNPESNTIDPLMRLIARPPRDPRFRITWQTAPHLHIAVDAVEGRTYLNGQPLTVDFSDQPGTTHPSALRSLPQVAPGKYEIDLPAPRSPAIVTVRLGSRAIDRFAVAGRYAPEFDAIGNDYRVMDEIARRSGGAVIDPRQETPIEFHQHTRDVSLSSVLAALGAAMFGCALAFWRWS